MGVFRTARPFLAQGCTVVTGWMVLLELMRGQVVKVRVRLHHAVALAQCLNDDLGLSAGAEPLDAQAGRLTPMQELTALVAIHSATKQKPNRRGWAFARGVPDNDLLSHGQSVLSSARRRFTVLFGMGRCGTSGL